MNKSRYKFHITNFFSRTLKRPMKPLEGNSNSVVPTPKRKKKDPNAYLRLKNRMEANFRNTRQKERWKMPEILQVQGWREKGISSVEIAKRLERSLASVQGIYRKFNHLEKLRLPIEQAVVSEKILYEMVRKRGK